MSLFSTKPLPIQFCAQCHNMLNLPEVGSVIECNCCGFACSSENFEVKTVISRTKLRQPKEREVTIVDQRATVKEICPKCQHNKLRFSTAQLRSADEGQTVFYQCTRCMYKFSVNN
eukprot:TRINITY_DN16144_c0_g1_i1.p1 TRINITY_DN16144_c0_g1~~TRINITY_DN16144_c0_g1_i1.p1  ORF type:complete len:116 (-),score=14.58 TRINITY_DN16144_c0_g1_i1:82-429(-)